MGTRVGTVNNKGSRITQRKVVLCNCCTLRSISAPFFVFSVFHNISDDSSMSLRQPCHLLPLISRIESPSHSGLESWASSCVCAVQPLAIHYLVVDHLSRRAPPAALVGSADHSPQEPSDSRPWNGNNLFSRALKNRALTDVQLQKTIASSALIVSHSRHALFILMTALASSGSVPGPHKLLVGEPWKMRASNEPDQWVMSNIPRSCMCTTCRHSQVEQGPMPSIRSWSRWVRKDTQA